MTKRNFKHDCSGQVIIVSALLLALLLLSTAIYVIEVNKSIPDIGEVKGTSFDLYRQSTRNTLISTLANVTNGGETTVLDANLAELKTVMLAHSYQASLKFDYTILTDSPYTDGFWISWGTNGQGVSSAYTNFVMQESSSSGVSDLSFDVNVTSELHFSGVYTRGTGAFKQVTLTVNILNEANPALAQNFTFYGDYDGSLSTEDWIKITSPNITDNGDGTYTVTFSYETKQRGTSVYISTLCHDLRGILLNATASCAMT